jgi:hypothetical protein
LIAMAQDRGCLLVFVGTSGWNESWGIS